jgi:hypothetical protein
MEEMEIAALQMIGSAANLYNDAEIVREAINGDDSTSFSSEYLEAERDHFNNSVADLLIKVGNLCSVMGVGWPLKHRRESTANNEKQDGVG